AALTSALLGPCTARNGRSQTSIRITHSRKPVCPSSSFWSVGKPTYLRSPLNLDLNAPFRRKPCQQHQEVPLAAVHIHGILRHQQIAHVGNLPWGLDQFPNACPNRVEAVVDAVPQVEDRSLSTQLAGELVLGLEDDGFA